VCTTRERGKWPNVCMIVSRAFTYTTHTKQTNDNVYVRVSMCVCVCVHAKCACICLLADFWNPCFECESRNLQTQCHTKERFDLPRIHTHITQTHTHTHTRATQKANKQSDEYLPRDINQCVSSVCVCVCLCIPSGRMLSELSTYRNTAIYTRNTRTNIHIHMSE